MRTFYKRWHHRVKYGHEMPLNDVVLPFLFITQEALIRQQAKAGRKKTQHSSRIPHKHHHLCVKQNRESYLFLHTKRTYMMQGSILSFGSLTMTTSMSSFHQHSGLKPPPPLATAKFVDTKNTKDRPTGISDSDHRHPKATEVAQSGSSSMPSPRKSVEFILHPPPAKRTKLDVAWTAKQVVDGK